MVDQFTAMFLASLDELDEDIATASAATLRDRLAAEVKVKRAVVDQHQQSCADDRLCLTCHVPFPCPTLRLHAEPFEKHPQFDRKWLIPKP